MKTQRRSTTVAAILEELATSGPGYGPELMQRINGWTNGAVVLGQWSIYPALRDLERQGLLRSWDGETTPERAGRPRRYYEVTDSWRRAVLGLARR